MEVPLTFDKSISAWYQLELSLWLKPTGQFAEAWKPHPPENPWSPQIWLRYEVYFAEQLFFFFFEFYSLPTRREGKFSCFHGDGKQVTNSFLKFQLTSNRKGKLEFFFPASRMVESSL